MISGLGRPPQPGMNATGILSILKAIFVTTPDPPSVAEEVLGLAQLVPA